MSYRFIPHWKPVDSKPLPVLALMNKIRDRNQDELLQPTPVPIPE